MASDYGGVQLGNDQPLASVMFTNTILAGGHVTRTQQVQIPTTGFAGDMFLVVQVDTQNSVLAAPFELMGNRSYERCVVVAALESGENKRMAEAKRALTDPHRVVLPLRGIKPGAYTLRLTLLDSTGKRYFESTQPITMHAGPLY